MNFVTATTMSTTPVAIEPVMLMTMLRRYPFSRSFWWCFTIPNCESVNEVNTPTA